MAFEEQPGITSEVVQKVRTFDLPSTSDHYFVQYLEENQQLLLSILENQNLGKLEECSLCVVRFYVRLIYLIRYQARVQQNLLFLARLAEPYTSHQPDGSQQNNKYNLRQGPRQNVFASLEPADSLSQESQASLPHTEAHPPQPLSAYVMRNGHSTVTAVTQPPAVFHYLGTLADQTSKNENSGYWQPDGTHKHPSQSLQNMNDFFKP